MRANMMANALIRVCDSSAAVTVYAGLYIVLDWLSYVHAEPSTGFTLWNPPAACNLALLLIRGLGYAPALFVVGSISDGLIAEVPTGLAPTLAANAIAAGGYTAVAAALRRLSHADQGVFDVSGIAWLAVISALGVLAIAGVTTTAFVLMHVIPTSLFASAVGHFWIGDLTLLVAGFLLCRLREHERFVGDAELPLRRVDFVILRAESHIFSFCGRVRLWRPQRHFISRPVMVRC
jgi:hypothetical protein